MVHIENVELRTALRVAKSALLDAIGRMDSTESGDLVPLDELREAYGRVALLLQELEAGRWEGRSLDRPPGRSVQS